VLQETSIMRPLACCVALLAWRRALAFLSSPSSRGVTWRGRPPCAPRAAVLESDPSVSSAEPLVKRPRGVSRVERPTRLPVWPAWNGIVFILLDLVGLRELSAKLEDWLGGRVAPMMLDPKAADPFILLVHHRHSFLKLDPLRAMFRGIFMAEGFPAHPHRGFETVTYVLPGKRGLVHRDSLGVKMRYSDGACQWMTAGKGMLHEEMWETDLTDDDQRSHSSGWGSSEAELYQLWLNLPPQAKMTAPKIQLVTPAAHASDGSGSAGGSQGPPEIIGEGGAAADARAALASASAQGLKTFELTAVPLPVVAPRSGRCKGCTVRVLSDSTGQAGVEGAGSTPLGAATFSPVSVLHVELAEGGAWEFQVSPEHNVLVYVRKGSVAVGCPEAEPLKVHELAYLSPSSASSSDGVYLEAPNGGADVLVLCGVPLGYPVASSGTMVMNTDQEVDQAFQDYQRGAFGVPWEHTLDDAAWLRGVQAWRQRYSGD